MATTYDGQTITRDEMVRVSYDLQMLRSLRIEPPEFASFGLTLLPQTGSERDDALSWILIQRAAAHNGLGASRVEAFNLVASVLGLQDFDSLDQRAKEMNANADYLIDLGQQYLVAEQYRQLVSGIEFSLPTSEDATGSPGLRRVIAMNTAMQQIQQRVQQTLQQFGQFQQANPQIVQQLQMMAIQSVLVDQGYLDMIQGHERFSATELRYALQREFTEIDLTAVVLDAEDRLETTSVDDAYIQKIFEQFADDEPGAGQPYGLGYREPNKVRLEALHIPIEAVREVVAKTITPEDVRQFYNDNQSSFLEDAPPAAEGQEQAPPQIAKLTPELREQIRLTLTQMRAEQKVVEIAQKARLRLNEDARGLPDDGPYKVLPDGFSPTPLVQLAAEIEAEHGVAPEIITVNDFVSSQEIVEATRFTQAWLTKMPTSTVKMPDEQGFGFLMDREVPEAVLGGKAGLFASFVPELSDAARGQLARLADYVSIAQPFLSEEEREQTGVALQVGLPGMVLSDMTRSTYVFRISQAQPARPAPSLTPIVEQVREDALKIKAYEDLLQEKDALLKQAAEQSIEKLMPDADAKTTLTALTRESINQGFGATIPGVTSTQPILQRAFQITDDLLASGGFDQASESDRLFAIELPGDYKLAVVRVDSFRPMTRAAFEEQAARPASLMLATSLGMTELPQPALSFEALKRYTGFKWAEGFGDQEEGEADEAGDESVE